MPERGGRAADAAVVALVAVVAGVTDVQIAAGYHPGTLGPIPGLLTLFVAPCVLLRPVLAGSIPSPARALLVAVPTNLILIMAVGLGVDLVGLGVGESGPLSHLGLAVAEDSYLVILLVVGVVVARCRHEPYHVGFERPHPEPGWRDLLTFAVGALGLLLAVTGAIRLNNGRGSGVGTTAVALLLVLSALLYAFAPQLRRGTAYSAIFLLSAALLLRTSMRGWLISGPDSQGEFAAFVHVAAGQAWHPGGGFGAYNACLSITILPQVVTQLTGISGIFVWKAVVPLLFALTPLFLFALAERFLGPRRCVVAVLAYVFFPAFVYSMAFAARQEVAFLFVGLLAYLLVGRLTVGRQALAYLAVAGIILSHYSTSYYLLAMLVIAKLLQVVLGPRVVGAVAQRSPSPVRRRLETLVPLSRAHRPRASGLVRGPFSVLLILFCLVGVGVWDGAVNQITGDVFDVAQNRLPAHVGTEGEPSRASAMTVRGSSALRTFADQQQGSVAPGSTYPRSVERAYVIRSATILDEPLTGVGRTLADGGVPPGKLNSFVRSLIARGYQLFAVLGLIGLALRRRWRDWTLFLYGVANGILVLAINISPVLTQSYGAARGFQQGLAFLAPIVALGLSGSVRRARVPAPVAVTGGAALLSVASLGGLLPQITGGYVAQIDLNNSGAYAEDYLTTQQEVSAILWTGTHLNGETLQMNPYLYDRLQEMIGLPTIDSDFPTVVRPSAVLMLGTETTRTGVDTAEGTLAYAYPGRFLFDQRSRIYANDGAGLYG